MKVGDLVIIKEYGSTHAPNGTIGVIIEELSLSTPGTMHSAYRVQCSNGYVTRHADFCLEVINESR